MHWMFRLIVAVSFAWLGLAEAHAANCSSLSDGCTKPQAYAVCQAVVENKNVVNPLNTNRCADYKSNSMWLVQTCYIAYGNCGPTGSGWSEESSLRYYYASGCPAGQEWNDASRSCSTPCSARPSFGGTFAGDAGSCLDGCQFAPDITAGGITRYDVGGKVFTRAAVLAPTGASCTASPDQVPPDSDACVQQGTLTQCVKPDGRTCAKSSTGKLFCYDSGESGAKFSGNESTVITPEGVTPKPPTNPPANGGEWVKAGEGTITVTKDGVTTTRTVTTYVSNYGPQGKNDGAEGEKGEGDDEGIKASTGPGCDQSSFQCSDMSSVECNQLIQTWYLRCKGKQINGGANCEAPPVCEGNSVDCFVSHQLWKYRCEGKSEVDSDGASLNAFDAQSESDGDGTDEPDAAHMPGNGDTADMGIWEEKTVGGAEDLAKLNASGFLGGSGSCPQLPSVSVGGRGSLSFNLNPICDLLRNVGIMVMALAYWLAYRIIAKARK